MGFCWIKPSDNVVVVIKKMAIKIPFTLWLKLPGTSLGKVNNAPMAMAKPC